MSIPFACEHCGVPIVVEDQFGGRTGHCKHCGAALAVPARPTNHAAIPPPEPPEPGLRLRPVEGPEPAAPAPSVAPGPSLRVRPIAAPDPAPSVAPLGVKSAADHPIEVLDPDHFAKRQAHRAPLNPHYETRIAREAARFFRKNRDRLYLLSLALLVLTLIAFLLKRPGLMRLGILGVIAANALMLVDGILYLLVIPFRESFAQGVGATIFPPYHWIRHWDRMKHPFLSTVRSFVPVVLAGLFWFGYEERTAIERRFEQVEHAVETRLGIEPQPARPGRPDPRPSALDEATKALGGESRIIQDLAQPH